MKLFSEEFKKSSPVLKALFAMLIVCASTFFLHKLVMKQSPDTAVVLREYYLESLNEFEKVFDFVITTPYKEEIMYRGPAWLILIFLLPIARKFEWGKIAKAIIYTLAALTVLVFDYFWAFGGHYYPITTFGFGIIWGTLMIYTASKDFEINGKKTIFAPFISIILPIIFHSGSNAIALIYIFFGYHLIC